MLQGIAKLKSYVFDPKSSVTSTEPRRKQRIAYIVHLSSLFLGNYFVQLLCDLGKDDVNRVLSGNLDQSILPVLVNDSSCLFVERLKMFLGRFQIVICASARLGPFQQPLRQSLVLDHEVEDQLHVLVSFSKVSPWSASRSRPAGILCFPWPAPSAWSP